MSVLAEREPALELIDEPSVWYGSELARSDDWIHKLTSGELAEVAAALAEVERRQLPIMNIAQSDFPLPTLGPRLTAMRDVLLDGRGFMLLRGLP